jgi:amino acid transporter
MARDRQLPGFLAKVHPTRRVPVNATFLVAAISIALGLYMNSRPDGITLLSTLVNFGALSAFLLLHVSVVVHFIVRKKSRDYWRHLVVPVVGFGILLYVVINAQVAAQRLGFVWLGIGVVLLVGLKVAGREPELTTEEAL